MSKYRAVKVGPLRIFFLHEELCRKEILKGDSVPAVPAEQFFEHGVDIFMEYGLIDDAVNFLLFVVLNFDRGRGEETQPYSTEVPH